MIRIDRAEAEVFCPLGVQVWSCAIVALATCDLEVSRSSQAGSSTHLCYSVIESLECRIAESRFGIVYRRDVVDQLFDLVQYREESLGRLRVKYNWYTESRTPCL